jgi:hypothetical protein
VTGDAHHRVVPEHEVLLYLGSVTGAVTTDELVERARRAGAPVDVVRTLRGLPERRWADVEEVAASIGTGWSADPGPG